MSYFSPTRQGRPRIVNRQRGTGNEFRADIKVGDGVIGHVERDSGRGGGIAAGEYRAYLSGSHRLIGSGRALSDVLVDLYAAQDARELAA
jgi:hypothetical protein